MEVKTRSQIEARIREIDEEIRNFQACEMTEGWLFCSPEASQIAELYHEREQVLRQLSKAA